LMDSTFSEFLFQVPWYSTRFFYVHKNNVP
jgi:hypothetical protein